MAHLPARATMLREEQAVPYSRSAVHPDSSVGGVAQLLPLALPHRAALLNPASETRPLPKRARPLRGRLRLTCHHRNAPLSAGEPLCREQSTHIPSP